jgi:hypothetical protein
MVTGDWSFEMVNRPRPIDVSDSPEVLRLAEEVEATNEPRLLRRGDRALALIVPLPEESTPPRPNEESSADGSAAGGWEQMDTEEPLAIVQRTAGMLRADLGPFTIEEETEAFEVGVALENAPPER